LGHIGGFLLFLKFRADFSKSFDRQRLHASIRLDIDISSNRKSLPMNTTSSYESSQKLHPPSLLEQLASRQLSGCFRVASGKVSWAIYLNQGNLIYASSSLDPFGRLDRQLRRLSIRIPSLVSAVRVQVRLLFETPSDDEGAQNSDYRAICWLVEQHHLSPDQAAVLVEELSKETLESFLQVQEGSYEFDERDQLGEFPQFCRLNLVGLVDQCQSQMRRRQALGQGFANADRASVPSRSAYLQPQGDRPTVDQPPRYSSFNGGAAPSAPERATHTIACIDDSPTVLNAINSFLNDKGIGVIMINDPVKALMQIIRSKPDLILLDVTMPNLDGYELCSLLRKHPAFKNTPVVMVTSNTGFIDRAKARLVGASGYLTKPFTQPDLVKMVFKHLS
jgi:two-component system, chemotaxis family, response regulator PixG